jgi:hypothetical protein
MRPSISLLAVIVALLAAAPRAAAYERSNELERVASVFALRAAEVRCPRPPSGSPIRSGRSDPGARLGLHGHDPRAHRHAPSALRRSCSGETTRRFPFGRGRRVPSCSCTRRTTFGAGEGAGTKPEFECRRSAISGSAPSCSARRPTSRNELLPYALAAHQRMVTLYPNYRAPKCRLPLWALPMSP